MGTETLNAGSVQNLTGWAQRDERLTSAVERSEGTQAARGCSAPSEGPGSLSAEKRQWAAGNLHLGSDCTKRARFFGGFFLFLLKTMLNPGGQGITGMLKTNCDMEKKMQVLHNDGFLLRSQPSIPKEKRFSFRKWGIFSEFH